MILVRLNRYQDANQELSRLNVQTAGKNLSYNVPGGNLQHTMLEGHQIVPGINVPAVHAVPLWHIWSGYNRQSENIHKQTQTIKVL